MVRATSVKRILDETLKTLRLKKIKHCESSEKLSAVTNDITKMVQKLENEGKISLLLTARKNVFSMRTIKKYLDSEVVTKLSKQTLFSIIRAALPI